LSPPKKTAHATNIRRNAKDSKMKPPKTTLLKTTFLGNNQSRTNKSKMKTAKTKGRIPHPPIPKQEAA
jgi:hypothetical protein